ncbi:MAG: hypothetical protein A2X49_06520 [Lentisphaerae bacterium GWF2_52_8]|nr:MAG: hypothetical protein A2X49_06520 [Lentisphaerae bacterium GWF2_52_8]
MKKTFLLAASILSLSAGLTLAESPKQDSKEEVEVVFVLDSTGSMGGLIEGAKQKIWSIANGIIARKPSPNVRFGLVSYRDKGDEYVSKVFDLTDDLDTVFKNLQSFNAMGGGDGPESVNQALNEAVMKISWSKNAKTVKTVFLVGDYPPHMDYKDDVKYQVSCQEAAKNNIVINTVQCGNNSATTPVWQEIARLAEGSYIALEQSGGMNAITTPYDEEMAKLSTELNKTVVSYGSKRQQADVAEKKAYAAAAPEVAASRATFNAMAGGKAIQGRGDLVSDLKDGYAKLETLKEEELPDELKKMSADERTTYIAKQQSLRAELNKKQEELARKRSEFIEQEKKRLSSTGKGDAFDLKVNEMINSQAERMKSK